MKSELLRKLFAATAAVSLFMTSGIAAMAEEEPAGEPAEIAQETEETVTEETELTVSEETADTAETTAEDEQEEIIEEEIPAEETAPAEEPAEEAVPEETMETVPEETPAEEAETVPEEEITETAEEITVAEETVETETIEEVDAQAPETEEVLGHNEDDASDLLIQEGALFGEAYVDTMETITIPEFNASADTFNMARDFARLNAEFVEVVKNWQTEFNVSSYNIPNGERNAVFSALINYNPQFFYLSSSYSSTYTISTNMLYSFTFNYKSEFTSEHVAQFQGRVIEIMADINSSWSAEQRALYLHDKLVTEVTYSAVGQYKYDAYNALVNGDAVCQGYALAYQYLMNHAGVECDIVTSDGINHAWNTVYINGVRYFVDCTWDDPTNMYLAYCGHDNFLVGQAAMVKENHTSTDWIDTWGNKVYGIGINTDYAGAYWTDVNTKIPHVGNLWAYTKKTSTNLYVHDYNTGANRVIASNLTNKWENLNEGGTYTYYFADVEGYQNHFVVSQPKEIRMYETDGTWQSIFNISNLPSTYDQNTEIIGIKRNGDFIRFDLYKTVDRKDFVTSVNLNMETINVCTTSGHDYRLKEWQWDEDLNWAIAAFVCTHDDMHQVFEAGTVTVKTIASTYSERGKKIYTATAVHDGVTYTDTKTFLLPLKPIPATAGLYYVNGQWKYYVNSKFTKTTGLVQRPDNKKWYYVKDGIYTKATGLCQRVDNGKWFYVKNGVYTKDTGVMQRIDNKKWYYVENGAYKKATGLALRPDNGRWYYIKDGAYTKVTGLVLKINSNKYYYVADGVYTKATGLCKSTVNGKWYYVKTGVYDTTFTGVVARIDNGKTFYVEKGRHVSYTGYAKDAAGRNYYVTNGVAVRV